MFVLWAFPYVLFSAFLMAAVHRLFDFPVELDDLIAISRESSDDDMIDLTDPNREADFRAGMTAAEFRANQRLRMVRMFEYLRRRLFNGLLMLLYAYTKQSKWKNKGDFESEAQAILIREVIKAGVNFRIYALFATESSRCGFSSASTNGAPFPHPALPISGKWRTLTASMPISD